MRHTCNFGGSLRPCGREARMYFVRINGTIKWLCAEHYDGWMAFYRREAQAGEFSEFFRQVLRMNR